MSIAGVGFSDDSSSTGAGREAAQRALGHLTGTRTSGVKPKAGFLFIAAKHDAESVIHAVRSVVGMECRLIGGSASGAITNDSLGYSGYEVGLALLETDATIDLLFEPDIRGREFACGEGLGRKIETLKTGASNAIVMYDSVRTTSEFGPPELNLATPLMEGMVSTMASPPLRLAGMGLIADPMIFHPCTQWIDSTLHQQGASAFVTDSSLVLDTMTLHGCRPIGGYHTITRAEGNLVLEIDGTPALEMITQLLGPNSQVKDFPLLITLGVNKGEKFGPFVEADYANRLCFAIDESRNALVMFEPDLVTGSEVQLMRRSIDLGYIGENVSTLLARQEGRRPVFALYIDCLGRAARFCGMETEEAAEVQKAIGDIPLLGAYSGVEIATVGGRLQALDWTGVLCLFSEVSSAG